MELTMLARVVCGVSVLLVSSTGAATGGFEIGETIVQGSCEDVDIKTVSAAHGLTIKAYFADFEVETDEDGGRETATCNLGIEVLHECGACLRVHGATWDGVAEISEEARGRASAAYYVNAGPHTRVSQRFDAGFDDDFTLAASELNEYVWDGRPVLLNADARIYVKGSDSYVMMDTAASEVEWRVSCCE
jgi:hypothetical protein